MRTTAEYDVALRVCRGYSSVSFAGEIADLWTEVRKPIVAYYLGDFDPSGFDLERDLRQKLQRYSGRACLDSEGWGGTDDEFQEALAKWDASWWRDDTVYWVRLAGWESDFQEHNLIALPVKEKDCRSKAFTEKYGHDCAEVDALPPSELRRRVEDAILSHVEDERWERLKEIEQLERDTLAQYLNGWKEEN